MTTDKITLTLTDSQMDEIEQAALTDWGRAVVLTFAAFGIDLLDPEGPRIRPYDYAIPSEQWKRISSACGRSGGLTGANHMLDWMNYGPSGFDA